MSHVATPPRSPGRRTEAGAPPPKRDSLSGFLIFLALAVVAAGLVTLAMFSALWAIVALGMAVLISLMAVLGPLRWGFMMLTIAFAIVPMYKGLGGGKQVTPPDLLLFLAFCALIPRLLKTKARVPTDFSVGLALMIIFGGIGSIASDEPFTSMFSVMLWIAVLGALPLGLASLALKDKEIQTLAWAYVLGHLFDSFYAAAFTPGRWYGLTTHPNFFGEYSVLAIALLAYLQQSTRPSRQWFIWVCGAICVLDIFMSGSRAAALALAVLLLVFPIVERSTKAFFLLACAGAVGLALFGTLAAHASNDSAIGRLLGQGTVAGSNAERENGLRNGWSLFTSHPLTGSGMTFKNVFLVHNNFLEVAVATGVIGFFGYVGLMVAYNRTVLLKTPRHRLGYAAVGLTIICAFEPSLYDRASWCAVALGFLAYQARPQTAVVGSDPPTEPEVRGTRT